MADAVAPTTMETLTAFFHDYNFRVSKCPYSGATYCIKNEDSTTTCLKLHIHDELKSIEIKNINKCGPLYGSGFNLLMLLKLYAKKNEFSKIFLQDLSYKHVSLNNGNKYEYSLATLFLLSTGKSYYNHFGFYHDTNPTDGNIDENVRAFVLMLINHLLSSTSFESFKTSLLFREFGDNDPGNNIYHPDSIPKELTSFKEWYIRRFDFHVSRSNEQLMTVRQFFSRVFAILYQKQKCDDYDDDTQRFFILSINLIRASGILSYDEDGDMIWKNDAEKNREKGVDDDDDDDDDDDIRERKIEILEIHCKSERCNPDGIDPYSIKSEFNEDGTCVNCNAPRSSYQVFIFPERRPPPIMSNEAAAAAATTAAAAAANDDDDEERTKRQRVALDNDGGTRRRVRRRRDRRLRRRRHSSTRKKKTTRRRKSR